MVNWGADHEIEREIQEAKKQQDRLNLGTVILRSG